MWARHGVGFGMVAFCMATLCPTAHATPAGTAAHAAVSSTPHSVSTLIDLNQATRAEIESARGVGVELAERLLQARRDGPFADWQDLRRRVKGVSRRALEGMAESGFHIAGQVPASR